jgi:hypothetical protein
VNARTSAINTPATKAREPGIKRLSPGMGFKVTKFDRQLLTDSKVQEVFDDWTEAICQSVIFEALLKSEWVSYGSQGT